MAYQFFGSNILLGKCLRYWSRRFSGRCLKAEVVDIVISVRSIVLTKIQWEKELPKTRNKKSCYHSTVNGNVVTQTVNGLLTLDIKTRSFQKVC